MKSRPIAVRLEQGSAAWHAWRRSGVGSSDIPVITGDAPWRNVDVISLYQEKLGYAAPRVETESMAAGKWLEDVISRWWAESTGRRIRAARAFRAREAPFAIASPDRETKGGLLEVKIADHPGDEWGKTSIEKPSDQIPDHYLEQVQWQALVADVDVVDVAVFFTRTRQRLPYAVPRDRTIGDELLEYGAAFWRCVEERTPPTPAERRLALPLREDEIEADAELEAFTQRYLAAKDDLAAMEEELEAAKELIAARLVDVGGARGDGFRIHYRPQADRTVVAWEKAASAFRDRLLELGADPNELDGVLADLTTTKPGPRPLSVRRAKERSTDVAA